jgi:preprotein translocase subunit YajC
MKDKENIKDKESIMIAIFVLLISMIAFSFIRLRNKQDKIIELQERLIEQNDSIKSELILLNEYLYN